MTTELDIDDDNDADYGGMTLRQIGDKHRRLRGSDNLKYLPLRSLRCLIECDLEDQIDGEWGSQRGTHTDHQCFLRPSHAEPCQFSSECRAMHSGVVQ